MSLIVQLEELNKEIAGLEQCRAELLRQLRGECKHVRLVELTTDSRSRRICAECGAEEEGGLRDYRVLSMNGDIGDVPHKIQRVLILRTSNSSIFYDYRKAGPLYFVGQSHPNFKGNYSRTYEELTAVT
jgi:hypothetical protein